MGYKYIICYKIPGLSDFHISDGTFGINRKKGFYTWYCGCGIGGPFKSIEKAKEHAAEFAKNRLQQKLKEIEEQFKIIKKPLLESKEDKYFIEWIENYRVQNFKDKEQK